MHCGDEWLEVSAPGDSDLKALFLFSGITGNPIRLGWFVWILNFDFCFLRIELFLTLLKDLLRTNSMWTWHSFSLTRLLLYFLHLIIMKKVAIEELTSEWVLVRPPDFSSTKWLGQRAWGLITKGVYTLRRFLSSGTSDQVEPVQSD